MTSIANNTGCTGLILARGGHAGVPNRNIKMLAGKPLLAWSLSAMVDSGAFERVVVSTDSDDIAFIAEKYGAEVYRRDPKYAKKSVSSLDATKEFLTANPSVQKVCLVQCISPCIQPFHLQEAIAKLQSAEVDSVFSVYRQKTFRWKVVPEGSYTSPLNFDPKYRPRRQDWQGELHENGAFYASKRDLIMSSSSLQGGKCVYYEMGEEFSTIIDTEFAFDLAQTTVAKYGYHNDDTSAIKRISVNQQSQNSATVSANMGA